MRLETLVSRVSVTAPLGLPEVAGDPLNVGIVWDAENRLTEVRQGAATLASFVYDGLGRRQQKTAGGVTHTYVSDESSLIEERVSTGATLRYVEGPGIDQHLARQDGAVTYYVADLLGSVVRATNSAGTVTLARKYDPWGNMLAGASAAGWAFTGREWDPETNLYFYQARYYDPRLARFLSDDPIMFRGGHNFYGYVEGNPMSWTDPTGTEVRRCKRKVKGFEWAPDLDIAKHHWLCVKRLDRPWECNGQTPDPNKPNWVWPPVPGNPSNDPWMPKACKETVPPGPNEDRFEECVIKRLESSQRPPFTTTGFGSSQNCQQWADDVIRECHWESRKKESPPGMPKEKTCGHCSAQ